MNGFGWARYATIGVAVVLALGGCQLQRSGDGSGDGNQAGGSGDKPAEQATEVRVDRSFWHRGFKTTLGTAKVLPAKDGKPPVVTIEATFQNLSPEYDSDPTSYMMLTVGNRTYAEVSSDYLDVPGVPAQRSQPGVLAFKVDEHFVLADAVLVVGKPDGQQASVPLGRPEGLVALEPRPFAITGKVTWDERGTFFMSVESGELRTDYPRTHQQAPTGKEFFKLNFSATNNSNAGMAIVFDNELTLKLPDGTRVGYDGTCSRAQIWPEPHSTATGGVACFLVPAPASGTYTLIWDNYEKGALKIPVS